MLLLQQLFERRYQIIKTNQVTVFVIADEPRGSVIDCDALRNLMSLSEVDHPHVGFAFVVNEQQRTSNKLKTRNVYQC